MNFVALLLGLGVERLLTNLFHLREFRWLDPVIDGVARRFGGASRAGAITGVLVYALACVLPVALLSLLLSDALFQIPYFMLAVVVLLFSLGPRDLVIEVQDYCRAVRDGNAEDTDRIVRELREGEPPSDTQEQITAVRRAIFVQANNRIFAVVFWFLLFGPTGAWLFRVVDLMRRRMAYEYSRQETPTTIVWAVRTVHGLLAWPSARLLASAYALAGSFDGGVTAWREPARERANQFFVATNDLLDRVGNGAAVPTRPPDDGDSPVAPIEEAIGLVTRALWLIWAPVIALMTLSDWLS